MMNMNRINLISIGMVLLVYGIIACKKTETHKYVDYNSIPAVIADNYNLSIFSKALELTGINQQLQYKDRPHTVIVPSNDAFALIGMPTSKELMEKSSNWIGAMAKYHVIPGKLDLKEFPYLINQVIPTTDGKRLFLSKWLRENEQILTLNGAEVLLEDMKSSTGLIQIVNRVLSIYEHDRVSQEMINQEDITLFSEAVRRAGLMERLGDQSEYTVFAPANTAMIKAGYGTLEIIKNTSKEELANFCSYHIASERRFVNDYVFSIGQSEQGFQTMINFKNVNVKLVKDIQRPGHFESIMVAALARPIYHKVLKRDILAGNGIIHVIDGILMNP